jgi:hypothetical protein
VSYKNVEGLLNVNNLEKTSDSELAAWADNLFDRSLNWKDVKWLQSITKLPIILKGILSVEDGKVLFHNPVYLLMYVKDFLVFAVFLYCTVIISPEVYGGLFD